MIASYLLGFGLSLPVLISLLSLFLEPGQELSLFHFLLVDSDAGGLVGGSARLMSFSIFAAGLAWCFEEPRWPRSLRLPLLGGLVFLALALVSAFTSSPVGESVTVWSQWVAALVALVVATNIDRRQAPVWLLGGLVVVVAANLFSLSQTGPEDFYLRGAFGAPNPMAGYCLCFVPFLLCLYLAPSDFSPLKLAGLAFLIALVLACIFLAISRAATAVALTLMALTVIGLSRPDPPRLGLGLLGLAIAGLLALKVHPALGALAGGMVVALFLGQLDRPALVVAKLAVVLAITGAVVGGLDSGGERLRFAQERAEKLVGRDNSTQARLKLWSSALEMARAHPWLGVGPGGYKQAYPRYQEDFRYFSNSPHSWVLTLASETGWVGLALVILALAGFVWSSLNQPFEGWALGLFLGALGLLVYDLVDTQLRYPNVVVTAACLAGLSWNRADQKLARSTVPLFAMVFVSLALFQVPVMLGDYYENLAKQQRAAEPRLAEASLRRSLAWNPYNTQAWHQLGLLQLHHLKQPGQAVNSARAALDLSPEHAPHWHLLGLGLEELGHLSEARQALSRALELDPFNHPYFYSDLSGYYQRRQQVVEGMALLELAVERFPLDGLESIHQARRQELSSQLANVYASIGAIKGPAQQPKQAEEAFLVACQLSPNLGNRFGLAYSLFSQNRYREATPLLKKVLAQRPDYLPALQMLAVCYDAEGLDERAAAIRRRFP